MSLPLIFSFEFDLRSDFWIFSFEGDSLGEPFECFASSKFNREAVFREELKCEKGLGLDKFDGFNVLKS